MTTTPVLLLIAGMLNDERVWADVRSQLDGCGEVRVVLPLQDSIAAMAAAAWDHVADVPDGVPLVVAGVSLGGYVAIEMLARPRRALHAAALVSTSSLPETPQGVAVRERTVAAMGRQFEKVVEQVAALGTHEPDAALLQRLILMMNAVGAETAIRQTRAIAARSDHRDALAALSLPRPLAVLCGAQDRITPPERAQEIASLVPGAVLQIVEGAGHMLPMERPEALAGALRRLLS